MKYCFFLPVDVHFIQLAADTCGYLTGARLCPSLFVVILPLDFLKPLCKTLSCFYVSLRERKCFIFSLYLAFRCASAFPLTNATPVWNHKKPSWREWFGQTPYGLVINKRIYGVFDKLLLSFKSWFRVFVLVQVAAVQDAFQRSCSIPLYKVCGVRLLITAIFTLQLTPWPYRLTYSDIIAAHGGWSLDRWLRFSGGYTSVTLIYLLALWDVSR